WQEPQPRKQRHEEEGSPKRASHTVTHPRDFPRMPYIRKVIKPATGSLTLVCRRPAHAERVGTAVVLSLDGELFAALIEAEDFIVQVQQRNNRLQPTSARYPVTHLGVQLGVRIEVDIAVWPFDSAVSAVLEVILKDVGVVVSESHTRRDALLVIRDIEVPVVRSLAGQRGVVRPAEIDGE